MEENKKNQKISSEEALEILKDAYKNMLCMQPDYDVRDNMLLTYYKKLQHKPVLFFVAAAIIGFTVANSIKYPFLPDGYRFLGVLGGFLVLGVLFPLLVFLIKKISLKNERAKIKIVEDNLKEFYEKRRLSQSLAFEFTNPRVIKKAIGQLERKRAHSLQEAIDFALAEYSKMTVFGLQKKENRNQDDIARFVAAHIDEIK